MRASPRSQSPGPRLSPGRLSVTPRKEELLNQQWKEQAQRISQGLTSADSISHHTPQHTQPQFHQSLAVTDLSQALPTPRFSSLGGTFTDHGSSSSMLGSGQDYGSSSPWAGLGSRQGSGQVGMLPRQSSASPVPQELLDTMASKISSIRGSSRPGSALSHRSSTPPQMDACFDGSVTSYETSARTYGTATGTHKRLSMVATAMPPPANEAMYVADKNVAQHCTQRSSEKQSLIKYLETKSGTVGRVLGVESPETLPGSQQPSSTHQTINEFTYSHNGHPTTVGSGGLVSRFTTFDQDQYSVDWEAPAQNPQGARRASVSAYLHGAQPVTSHVHQDILTTTGRLSPAISRAGSGQIYPPDSSTFGQQPFAGNVLGVDHSRLGSSSKLYQSTNTSSDSPRQSARCRSPLVNEGQPSMSPGADRHSVIQEVLRHRLSTPGMHTTFRQAWQQIASMAVLCQLTVSTYHHLHCHANHCLAHQHTLAPFETQQFHHVLGIMTFWHCTKCHFHGHKIEDVMCAACFPDGRGAPDSTLHGEVSDIRGLLLDEARVRRASMQAMTPQSPSPPKSPFAEHPLNKSPRSQGQAVQIRPASAQAHQGYQHGHTDAVVQQPSQPYWQEQHRGGNESDDNGNDNDDGQSSDSDKTDVFDLTIGRRLSLAKASSMTSPNSITRTGEDAKSTNLAAVMCEQ